MTATLSRLEKILLAKLTGTDYGEAPRSRLEELLLQINTSGGTDTTELTKEILQLKESVSGMGDEIQSLYSTVEELTVKVNYSPDKILANNRPEVIQKIASLGLGSNFWNVGDKVPIVLNGTVGSLTFKNDTWYAYIIGFNHNSELEGGNGIDFQFGMNANGVSVAFVDDGYGTINRLNANAKFCFNTDGTTEGGWENSYMRNVICPQFLAAMPSDWQKIIAHCTKYTDNVGNGTDDPNSVTATKDTIFLLSEKEVMGDRDYYYSNNAEPKYQKQYDFYKNGDGMIKYKHNAITSACDWRLRSIDPEYGYACRVTSAGKMNSNGADYSYGFSPAFRVA